LVASTLDAPAKANAPQANAQDDRIQDDRIQEHCV